jgi:2-methylcitrate dehydratase PrpD
LLALGDERRASGQAVLDAYIVGLEVIARVGEAVNMSHYLRGWHATATLGVLGAAAAAARLLGLDATRAATAISLATSMSAGFQSQFGTMAKPLHAGLAAKSGLLAASLAEAGMSASPRTLDGPVGLGALMSSSPNGFAGLEKRLGRPLAILEYGLCVKWHPCCYYAARSLDAILDLKREHPVNEHVKEILIRIPARNARIVAIERPATPDEARFSLRYCVAATVIHGELRAADFTVERVRSVDIESLMRRIRIESYDSDPAAADLSATDPDTVTIRFEDGSVAARSVAYPKGHARAPLSDAELMQKLAACTESMGAAQRRELRAGLLSFRIQPRIDSLTRLLRSAPSAASTKG